MKGMAERRHRVGAVAAVAALHLAVGYALVTGLGVDLVTRAASDLKLFDVPAIPPPPPEPEPEPEPSPAEPAQGDPAPPAPRASPSPVVAPPPVVRVPAPPPVTAAPAPGTGDARASGAAEAGAGTGAGGQGAGTGGGGLGGRAQRVSGAISNADYPRAALRRGAEGSVSVRYTAGADGRATGCAVTRSSGDADLDRATCRLIEERFRYRPARDAQGNAIPQTITTTFDWSIPRPAD